MEKINNMLQAMLTINSFLSISKNFSLNFTEEVDNIAKAASLSSEGLLDVMVASKMKRCENYLSSLFEFGCRSR